MTLTTTIYNTIGEPFIFTFEYEIEYCTFQPIKIVIKNAWFINESFGDGWQDDLVKALHEELYFDFELKII
jgi:hypothetical protein